MWKTEVRKSAPGEGRESFRLRRYLLSALLAVGFVTAGCSEAGLENTLRQLENMGTGGFESGDLEGLFDIPPAEIVLYFGSRLGLSLGPR